MGRLRIFRLSVVCRLSTAIERTGMSRTGSAGALSVWSRFVAEPNCVPCNFAHLHADKPPACHAACLLLMYIGMFHRGLMRDVHFGTCCESARVSRPPNPV